MTWDFSWSTHSPLSYSYPNAKGHEAWGCFWRSPLISKDRGRAHFCTAMYFGFVRLDSFMTKSIKFFCYVKRQVKSNVHSNGKTRPLFVLRNKARVDYSKLDVSFLHIIKNYLADARTSRPPRESVQPVIRHQYECHTRIRKHSANLFVTSTPVW